MTDILDRVRAVAPTDADLAHRFSSTRQAAVLERAVSAHRPARLGRRHVAIAAGVLGAAAAVVAVAAVPSAGPIDPTHRGTPPQPSAAPAAAMVLNHLATLAGRGASVGPDQFAHQKATTVITPYPRSVPAFGMHRDGVGVSATTERWTAPDGGFWIYRTLRDPRGCLEHWGPQNQGLAKSGYEQMSSAQLAALPTDPHALQRFFAAHPNGDNHGVVNEFIAAEAVISSDLASPGLRAAAMHVLAMNPHLTVESQARDALGRPAVRIDLRFDDSTIESLFLDPSSARVLETQTVSPNSTVVRRGGPDRVRTTQRSVVVTSDVVDAVPTNLRRCH